MTEISGLNPLATQKIFESLNEVKNNPSNPVLAAANKLNQEITNNKQELEKYRQDSLVDSLTGCYNRNFFEKYKSENFDPNRDHNKIGLVFVDLNDLKKTNDSLGHEAGDKLIKDSANFLKSNFRKDDTVIRLGGDEFVVICRNYQEDQNFEENLYFKVDESRILKSPVSFAFGVAVFDEKRDKNLDDTSHRADKLMYEHKREMKQNQ